MNGNKRFILVRNPFKCVFFLSFISALILSLYGCEATHKVYFHTNIDEVVIEQEVIHTGKASPPTIDGIDGHKLEGWYTSLDGGETLDERWSFTNDTVGNDISLYANWERKQYRIEFMTYGETPFEEQIHYHGDSISMPTPEKENAVFVDWYLDEELEIVFDYERMPAKNLVLHGKWERQEYSIEFMTYGGTTIDDQTYYYEDPISLPSPEKENAVFVDWFLDENMENVFDYESMPAKNLVLHAKWKATDVTSISYNLNGGTNHPDNQEILKSDMDYLSLLYPTKKGYSFQGWYDNPDFLGEPIYIVTQDEDSINIELFAKWGEVVEAEKLVIYYYRPDGNYDNWNLWLWPSYPESDIGKAYEFESFDEEKNMMKFELSLNSSHLQDSTILGIVVRKGNWQDREFEGDRHIYIENADSEGVMTIFILSGDNIYQNKNQFTIE